MFRSIARMAKEIREDYEIKLEYIDIGGGLFGDKPNTPSFAEYAKTIAEAFGDQEGVKLVVEPGASIISSPVSYLCQVRNIRRVGEANFATLDGSCMHIDPLMHGIAFAKHIYRKNDDMFSADVKNKHTLCGFTCIEMDRMGTVEDELFVGDRIEFLNCGSYSMTLAPLFIMYYPSVYFKTGNEFQLVRLAWDEKEFSQKCEVYR